MRSIVIVTIMFTTTACGGAGLPELTNVSPKAKEYLAERGQQRFIRTQAAMKADRIIYSADTLLMSSLDVHADEDVYIKLSCSGTRCVTQDGVAVTLAEVLADAENLATPDFVLTNFETRSGFYTARYRGGVDLSGLVSGPGSSDQPAEPGVSYQDDSEQNLIFENDSFAFWSTYGLASVGTAGFLANELPIFSMNSASVIGNAAGTNPETRATWRGIAEAYDAAGKTGSGTATLTVDLSSQPTVDAEIRIGLTQIGSRDWSNIPLSDGRFETGSGFDDHIVGNFHGSDHEEAWGAFDTRDWSGVFGAKK